MESDSTRVLLKPLMSMSSASFTLVLPLSRAMFISSLRGGDTVVVDPGGPIARITAGVLLNQGPLLEPLHKFVKGLGL